MQVVRLNRANEDFYAQMGPVFGSRHIEKETNDRFYDDAGKQWYLITGRGAASVMGVTIKNFWADSPEAAAALIDAMRVDAVEALCGVIPRRHRTVFEAAGFSCLEHRRNFMEVRDRIKR